MINEDQVEQITLDWFRELGYDYLCGYDIAPDSDDPQRDDYEEVILPSRLYTALTKLNPSLPASAIDEAIAIIKKHQDSSLIQNNRSFHQKLLSGIKVDIETEEGTQGERVKLVDFHNPDNNDFLVVNQFTVKGSKGNRRPDIIVFINGLPLSVIELKNPADESADILN
jgi:type I restriction enzyme R subunit